MTDRELDALVAEKVMGCKVESGITIPFTCGCGPRDPNKVLALPHATPGWVNICPYSSTGDGMLAVVEAMRGKGFRYSLCSDKKRGGHRASFKAPESRVPQNFGVAANLPRAVCFAALRALS